MSVRSLIVFLFLVLSCSAKVHAVEKPADRDAFAGIKSAKVIFDVRVSDVEKLVFNLKLFSETLEGMQKRGLKTEMIVAFRGAGVRLLSASTLDGDAVDLFRALKKKGVRIEACAVAMRLFNADPASLIPEVSLVSNVFNSLIGYQQHGFAMIVIN